MRRKQRETDNLADIRKRLGSANSETRYHAYLDAQNLSAEQLWDAVTTSFQQMRCPSLVRQTGYALGTAWILTVGWWMNSTDPRVFGWLMLFVCGPWTLLLCWVLVTRPDPQDNITVSFSRLLEHRQEARFAGPLLLIHAGTFHQDVRANSRQTLLRLLPTLEYTDMQLWLAAQKAELLNLARYAWGDLALKFAALDALAQAGEADAVKVIRELTGMQTAHIAEQLYSEHLSRDPTIERQLNMMNRRTAGGSNISFATRPTPFDCLPSKECEPYTATALYLQRKAQASLDSILERQERQRQTALLLRSAEQPREAQAQALLRPTCSTGADTLREQLLRPK